MSVFVWFSLVFAVILPIYNALAGPSSIEIKLQRAIIANRLNKTSRIQLVSFLDKQRFSLYARDMCAIEYDLTLEDNVARDGFQILQHLGCGGNWDNCRTGVSPCDPLVRWLLQQPGLYHTRLTRTSDFIDTKEIIDKMYAFTYNDKKTCGSYFEFYRKSPSASECRENVYKLYKLTNKVGCVVFTCLNTSTIAYKTSWHAVCSFFAPEPFRVPIKDSIAELFTPVSTLDQHCDSCPSECSRCSNGLCRSVANLNYSISHLLIYITLLYVII